MKAEQEQPIDVVKIKRILDANDGARVRTWLSVCSRCGLCAESCLFYLANGKNPAMSPAYKVKHTVGEMYRRNGEIDRPFLEACSEILWGECTTCKRCSLYCPFGIDIASLVSLGRTVCQSQGIFPDGLARTLRDYRKSGNQMGMATEEFVDICNWMEEEAAEELPGLTIPVDKPGARFMYTVNPREPMYHPNEIAMLAKIMTIAGESWTIPSFGWDCTNLAMFAGDRELAGRTVSNMYNKALELGAEKILLTECGHAYRSAAFEGPYLAGIPDGRPPVEIVHSVKLFLDLLKDGRLTLDPAKRLTEPVTYQDPCNVSRNGGLWEEAREIIGAVATDFRDMSPNRDHNHCCGGGGGYIPMGLDYKPKRMISGRIKAEQIRATGARIVIAPCHNCFDQIKDLNAEYHLDVKVMTFKDILCEMMVIPEKFRRAEGTPETGPSSEN